MGPSDVNRRQLSIDFEYDERMVKLSVEFALMMMPHLAPGTKAEAVRDLVARMVLLAGKRLDKFAEPPDQMRCHSCDALVGPQERARVVVCVRCGLTGRTPGSTG